MRTLINITFSEDLTEAALAQVRDSGILVFPTRISASKARQRFMAGWALQDCEFVAMEDFKDSLLLPPAPAVSDDKRMLCLYQALSAEDRDYFHISGYFDVVSWGNHFFQFFEELCDECVDVEILANIDTNLQLTLLAWQEDYLQRVLDIRQRYQKRLDALGLADPIFNRKAEAIRIPYTARRVVFVNQYYFSGLEKSLITSLEEAGNEVLVLVQSPVGELEGLEPPRINLASLEEPGFKLHDLEIVECENAEQMVLAFLSGYAQSVKDPGQAVIVDSHFSQAHYRDLFDPARFHCPQAESIVGSGIYQLLGIFQKHLEAMRTTLEEGFLPLRLILDACAQDDFLRFYGIPASEKSALLEELKFLLQNDILYVDRELQLLGRLRRKQGFPLLGEVLKSHFKLLDQLAKIARPQDLIDLIDTPEGIRVRSLCREEELLHSNILEVFYERLSNFASLETMGIVEDWGEVLDGQGLSLSASVLQLFLESLGSGKYRFHRVPEDSARLELSNLLDLRNLTYSTVFFFNAIEGEIPSNPNPVWLLNEAQRARLGLKSYPDLRERERYYFLRTVLSSDKCVIFTYRNLEKDIEPGSFVTELKQALDDKALEIKEYHNIALAPRVSTLYLAGVEASKSSWQPLPVLSAAELGEINLELDSFFTLPCSPEQDFGPEARIDAGYYSLACLKKNPFAWYLKHLRRLPELDLRPRETLTRKLFGSIMHAFLSAVLQPLAREGADLPKLEQAFTDTGRLRNTLDNLLNDPERLYLYKIPQNYNHQFLVSIISDNLVESVREFYTDFLEPRLAGVSFRLIPEEEYMTEQERKGRELIRTLHKGREYSVWIRGKADLRIECPQRNYIVDFKTGESNDEQLLFYEWLYYLLDEAHSDKELNSQFWLVFKRETGGKQITDQRRENWRNSLAEVFTDCLAQGFTLGKKAGDREELAEITRADLFRADRGDEE